MTLGRQHATSLLGRGAVAMIVVAAGLAGLTASVAGHAGFIDLIITPPIVEPGDEITIQGQALWTELPVEVALVDDGGAQRPLASGATAPDGSLLMTATLPGDISDGSYQVIVSNPYGETTHGAVIVRSAYPTPLIVGGIVLGVLGLLVVLRLARGRSKRATAPPAATT